MKQVAHNIPDEGRVTLTASEYFSLRIALKHGLFNTKENDTDGAIAQVQAGLDILNSKSVEFPFRTQKEIDANYIKSFIADCDANGAD